MFFVIGPIVLDKNRALKARVKSQIADQSVTSGNIEFLESIKGLKQKDPYVDHLSKPCMNIDYLNRINEFLGRSAS
jgi:hypothetical protein